MKIVRGAGSVTRSGRSAGEVGICLGAKILKASERFFLVVTDGLKMSSSPFSTLTFAFFFSRLCIKVRSSFLIWAVGLNFWASLMTMASATLAHLWGSLQPFCRSVLQPCTCSYARVRDWSRPVVAAYKVLLGF